MHNTTKNVVYSATAEPNNSYFFLCNGKQSTNFFSYGSHFRAYHLIFSMHSSFMLYEFKQSYHHVLSFVRDILK